MKAMTLVLTILAIVPFSLKIYAHGIEPEPCRVAVDNRFQLAKALFPTKNVDVVSTSDVIYGDKSGSYYKCAKGKLVSNGLCLYEDDSMLIGRNTEKPSKKNMRY